MVRQLAISGLKLPNNWMQLRKLFFLKHKIRMNKETKNLAFGALRGPTRFPLKRITSAFAIFLIFENIMYGVNTLPIFSVPACLFFLIFSSFLSITVSYYQHFVCVYISETRTTYHRRHLILRLQLPEILFPRNTP